MTEKPVPAPKNVKPATPPPPPPKKKKHSDVTFNHLRSLSMSDATVRYFINAWRNGQFESLEKMLIHLALQLCDERDEARQGWHPAEF